MEKNLKAALQCIPTLTELAVLALYGQAISHPYMCQIRGSGSENLNMLDQGPLHIKVQEHMERIIENPSLLVSADAVHTTGTVDGTEWERPTAVAKILEMIPELPHLTDVLVAYFKDALETWKRFTSEFDAGGLVDQATDAEKFIAWMSPTNDANEGILGAYRIFMRRYPHASLTQFNAQAMFNQNDTQGFMNKHLNDDDDKYIMQVARTFDSSGVEKQRRKDLNDHAAKEAEQNAAKDKEKERKNAEKVAKIKQVKLIFDKEAIERLKGQSLQDQVDAFVQAGATLYKRKGDIGKVAQKKEAIQKAIDGLQKGLWTLKTALCEANDTVHPDVIDEESEGE
jgi:DNA-binding phage protein